MSLAPAPLKPTTSPRLQAPGAVVANANLDAIYPSGKITDQRQHTFPSGRTYWPTFVKLEVDGQPGLVYDELLSPDLPTTTILSVYPEQMVAKLTLSGIKTFVMPAAPKGEWRAHRIYASGQNILDPESFPAPGEVFMDDARANYAPRMIPHDAIAGDVLRNWSGDSLTLAGTGHGVTRIAGLVPTAEELTRLVDRQDTCFRTLIREGDNLFQSLDSAMRKRIGAHHHLALEWIGDFDVLRHGWYQKVAQYSPKPCVACGEPIRPEAVVCHHCRVALDMFCLDREIMPTDEDPVLQAAVERLVKQAVKRGSKTRGK